MNIIPLMQQGFASSSKRVAKMAENFSGDEIFFRPYDKVNHFAWEVGHLAFIRNTIIKLLNPAEKLESVGNERIIFAPDTPLQANEMFSPLDESVEALQKRGDRIVELLANLTQEHWDSESPFKLPFGTTVGSQVWTFFMHESFHLGEMSYLKNILVRNKG
jgi:DinB superfamily